MPSSEPDVISILADAISDLIAVYQFGSTVEGGEHSKSDLDLAVLASRPLDNVDRWTLQEELASRLCRDVDLVDLRAASTVMRMQVVSRATVLEEWDPTVRQEFEMHVYSAYALLNEERAGILKDVQERGRVYG